MDLVEKARKIKLEMKTSIGGGSSNAKDQYSVSDSETPMAQFKKVSNTSTNATISPDFSNHSANESPPPPMRTQNHHSSRHQQQQQAQNHSSNKLNTQSTEDYDEDDDESNQFLPQTQQDTPSSKKQLPNHQKFVSNKNNKTQLLREESQSSLSDTNKIYENKNDIYVSNEFLNGNSNTNSTMQRLDVGNDDPHGHNHAYETYQKALSRSPSPPEVQSRDKKPLQTLSTPQLWKIDQDLNSNSDNLQSLLLNNMGGGGATQAWVMLIDQFKLRRSICICIGNPNSMYCIRGNIV